MKRLKKAYLAPKAEINMHEDLLSVMVCASPLYMAEENTEASSNFGGVSDGKELNGGGFAQRYAD